MISPFENDNIKVIKKLTARSFKANLLRNTITIIAIALTAILFTSVTTIGLGALDSMKLTMQIQKMSKSDADLRNMTAGQFEILKTSENIKSAGLRNPIGFLTNAERHSIELDYMDNIQQELTFCEPTHGKAPKKANEIVASDLAFRALGIKPVVGAVVPIEFTAHGQNYQLDMVVSGWYESLNDQISVMVVSPEFKNAHPEVFTYTYQEDHELAGTYWSDITVEHKSDLQNQLNSLIKSMGGNPTDIEAQNYLPATINTQTNPQLTPQMISLPAILLLLFIFCGYLLIYNVFDIAVMQEIRRYGLYRTVGMSKKQIKALINIQAIWLSCIGIPLGLAIGYFLGLLALPKVMDLAAVEYSRLTISVTPNPLIFLSAIILSLFTVYLSTRRPINSASNTSPIEAFRYVENHSSKKLSKKGKGGIKLYKIALSNLGRNKRRSLFIIVSLMLCVTLLNVVGTIANSVDVEKQVNQMIRTDFEVVNVNTMSKSKGFLHRTDSLNIEAIKAINNQPGVTNGSMIYKNTGDDREVSFDYGMTFIEYQELEKLGTNVTYGYDSKKRSIPLSNDRYPICNVYGMDQTGLGRLNIIEGETNKDVLLSKLTQGDSLIIGVATKMGSDKLMAYYDYIPVGHKFTARINNEVFKTYTVIAKAAIVSDDTDISLINNGSVSVGGDAPVLYLPTKEFKTLYQSPTILKYAYDVAAPAKDDMDEFLIDYMKNEDPSMGYLSAASARAGAEATRTMIYAVGGMIGTIFGIAGILNLINMIITSILSRRREFATMKSIGMTAKQLRTMLTLEGCYYALGAAFIGLIMAAVLNYTLIRTVCSSMWNFTFQPLLAPALWVSVGLIIFSLIIPTMALNVFHRGSVVELLRIAE